MENPALYGILGRNIAAARARALPDRLSQSGLAAKIGVTRGSIANIELGDQRPPLHVVWAIGLALGVEPASLLPSLDELDASLDGRMAVELDPAVEKMMLASPRARAWLTMTRAKLENFGNAPTKKRNAR